MGTFTVIVESLTTVKPGAVVPPNSTNEAPVKLVPVIVTEVVAVPVAGLRPVTAGTGGRKVNLSAGPIAEVPTQVVTVTSTGVHDAVPAGETAVIDMGEFTIKLVALVAPNFTAVALVKSVPLIVTEVPPAGGPDEGLNPLTTGGNTPTL